MQVRDDAWGADAPISMPVPPEGTVLVPLGDGMGFTAAGLVMDLNEADLEEVYAPIFAPEVRGSE